MDFVYNDGGRSKYFKGIACDCVTRAVSIATGLDYKKVYDDINDLENSIKVGKRERKGSARNGVRKKISHHYIEKVLNWQWHPTMTIGSGCQVHLESDELPSGTIIASVSGHLCCIKDGVLYDTHDCTRDGDRCVYGYWTPPTEEYLQEIEEAKRVKEITDANLKKCKEEIAKVKKEFNAKIKKLERERDKTIAKLKKQYGDKSVQEILGDR